MLQFPHCTLAHASGALCDNEIAALSLPWQLAVSVVMRSYSTTKKESLELFSEAKAQTRLQPNLHKWTQRAANHSARLKTEG